MSNFYKALDVVRPMHEQTLQDKRSNLYIYTYIFFRIKIEFEYC